MDLFGPILFTLSAGRCDHIDIGGKQSYNLEELDMIEVQDADLITFVDEEGTHVHSGLLYKKDGNVVIKSKLGKASIYETSVKDTLDFYDKLIEYENEWKD